MCLLFFHLKFLHVKNVFPYVELILCKDRTSINITQWWQWQAIRYFSENLDFPKNEESKKITREFLDKNLKSSTLKNVLKKINKQEMRNATPWLIYRDNISPVEDLILSQDNDTHDNWYFMLICSPHSKKWYWLQGIQEEKSTGASIYHKAKETETAKAKDTVEICCEHTQLSKLRESGLVTERCIRYQNYHAYSNKSKK